MKKLFLASVLFSMSALSLAQINPVQNLTWDHEYVFGNNYFTMEWEEPALPHDQLIGYNIYREDELYRFQTENVLFNIEEGSNCEEDFLFFNNGEGFFAHVTAVYEPNETESNFDETVLIEGILLSNNDLTQQESIIYPNPTTGILFIPQQADTKITLFDVSGSILKEYGSASQIDLSEMPSGMYFVLLISADKRTMHKVIVK